MLRVGCRYSAVSPIYMSNDRLEPFNYHNIAFKRCADVVSLERLDRLWFFRHYWFVKIGWFGKCWTDLLAFWGVWNRSRILNFGPDRLFFRFSRALICVSLDVNFNESLTNDVVSFEQLGPDIFLISPQKPMLWVLIRSASVRHF